MSFFKDEEFWFFQDDSKVLQEDNRSYRNYYCVLVFSLSGVTCLKAQEVKRKICVGFVFLYFNKVSDFGQESIR